MPTSTSTPTRLTQAERRSRSEERLLDAAASLIAERGVDGASLALIGERAGVSRGLVSHHFGTKDALIARLAERAQDRIQETMRGEAALRQGRSYEQMTGLEVVQLTVDSYLDLFADPTPDQRALLVMWGSTFAQQASVDGMADAERRSYDGLAGVIERGQRDGSIRADVEPLATAVLLLGIIRGVAALALTDAAIIDLASVRATCRTLLTTGLAR